MNYHGEQWVPASDLRDFDYRLARELLIEQREREIIAQRTAQQNADALEHGDDPIEYDDRDWHCSARAQAEKEVP